MQSLLPELSFQVPEEEVHPTAVVSNAWYRFGFSASGEMHLPAWCSALKITSTLLPTPVDFTGGDKGLRGVRCLSEGIVCLSVSVFWVYGFVCVLSY